MNNFGASLPSSAEFDFWVGTGEVIMQDEELSASSHKEATQLFEQWQSEDDEMEIMEEVDMHLGPNYLLSEEILNLNCASLVAPNEDIDLDAWEKESVTFFSYPDDCDSSHSSDTSNSLEFNEQYRATLRKLSESMKRSHETRKSLMMKTPKTERYARSTSVSGVISSIEKSSEQIQAYLDTMRVDCQ